jgi:putative ATP-binding cassette transporter
MQPTRLDVGSRAMSQLATDLRAAWSLALPYLHSRERWRARTTLTAVIGLNVLLVGTTLLFTYWQGAFYNALEAKNWKGFLGSLLWWTNTPKDGFALGFAPTLAIFVVATALELYLRQGLQMRWRRWMTETLVHDWLSERTYFRMTLIGNGADNPDQRIAEDARLFLENGLILVLGVIRSFASLFAFVLLLWHLSAPLTVLGRTIPGYLVWIAVLYAICGSWLTHLVGRRLTPLHYVQQRTEADFRFSLMRLLENVEGVAFHAGETEQERELSHRFGAIVTNWLGIMTATLQLTFLTSIYAQWMLVFPLAVVAPAYFAGKMALGGIFETSNAFVQVQTALSWFVQSYADLTSWLATVERLAGFRDSITQIRSEHAGITIVAGGNHLQISALDLMLPDGGSLLRGVDLVVPRGDRLLIQGSSGSGKSTLLRAIAGIWPFGTGAIRQPSGTRLFMPQHPYMPLGSLKRVACYPLDASAFSDIEVAAALQTVGLDHLCTELAKTDTWERRLSGGEQQRLALARALLIRPDWLFMDEATSGLDPTAESQFYSLLRERLPEATIVSIAHRDDVRDFHTRVVHIDQSVLRESKISSSHLG